MTATTMTDLDLLRARMAAAMGGQLPGHIRRLAWSPAELAAFQRDRLRALLARAIERSPFHAARLRGVDPGRFELADLPRLPVMTKAQMMENFDAALTDRRLTRNLVERHLASSAAEPSLLLGEYVCLLSGGSSGRRGLIVQTVSEYADFVGTINRRAMAEAMTAGRAAAGRPGHRDRRRGHPGPLQRPGRRHGGRAAGPPDSRAGQPAHRRDRPAAQRRPAARPARLRGQAGRTGPRAARPAAPEPAVGHLEWPRCSAPRSGPPSARPSASRSSTCSSPPRAWSAAASREARCSPSPATRASPSASTRTAAPSPTAWPRPRCCVTNLHNLTQPLIRYELTDRFTPAANPAGGFLRASVDGRADDLFRYPAASVHPFVIGTPLLRAPAVREFQVRQTERGADLAVVVDGDLDVAALTADVRDGLRQAGLPGPQVTLRRVEALDRDPLTGKARRFIPLGPRIP